MGLHIIGEFLGVEERKLSKIEDLKPIVEEVIKESRLNTISYKYHQFEPHGVTCVYLLRESHLALHTWPEVGYVAIDIFTCDREGKAEKVIQLLKEKLNPKKIKLEIIREFEYEKLLQGKNSSRASRRR